VWLYLLVVVMFLVAIGVQVLYLRRYAEQVTGATKTVMLVNIGLLVALMTVVSLLAYSRMGG
jgi:hypothetical protein